jgi:hypothetical protein
LTHARTMRVRSTATAMRTESCTALSLSNHRTHARTGCEVREEGRATDRDRDAQRAVKIPQHRIFILRSQIHRYMCSQLVSAERCDQFKLLCRICPLARVSSRRPPPSHSRAFDFGAVCVDHSLRPLDQRCDVGPAVATGVDALDRLRWTTGERAYDTNRRTG